VIENLTVLEEGTTIALLQFFTDKAEAQKVCKEMNEGFPNQPYYVQEISNSAAQPTSEISERIAELGDDITVLLDDRELKYFDFERDLEREQKLIDHYRVQDKEFVFVNRMFGSPPHSKPCPHMGEFENSVEMEYLGWDNLFDWIGLLLNAKHIYTVETSILYIISKLGLKNVTVYSRHASPSFHQVEHIFDKDLTYIL
jgi:hypothetical protein